MSKRARRMRALASLLTMACETPVRVCFSRQRGFYQVEWIGGPQIDQMREIATEHAEKLPDVDLATLGWYRRDQIPALPSLNRTELPSPGG